MSTFAQIWAWKKCWNSVLCYLLSSSCKTRNLYFYCLNVLIFKRSLRKGIHVAYCMRRILRYFKRGLFTIRYIGKIIGGLRPKLTSGTIWGESSPSRCYNKLNTGGYRLLNMASTWKTFWGALIWNSYNADSCAGHIVHIFVLFGSICSFAP